MGAGSRDSSRKYQEITGNNGKYHGIWPQYGLNMASIWPELGNLIDFLPVIVLFSKVQSRRKPGIGSPLFCGTFNGFCLRDTFWKYYAEQRL